MALERLQIEESAPLLVGVGAADSGALDERVIDADLIDPVMRCEDNLEFMAGLADKSMDLIVTSPPYNLGKVYEGKTSLEMYLESQARVIEECVRLLKPSGSICWQVGNFVDDGEVRRSNGFIKNHPLFATVLLIVAVLSSGLVLGCGPKALSSEDFSATVTAQRETHERLVAAQRIRNESRGAVATPGYLSRYKSPFAEPVKPETRLRQYCDGKYGVGNSHYRQCVHDGWKDWYANAWWMR